MRKIYFYIILLPLLFSSCKLMYVPNMQNVPQFKEQGEVKANLSTTNFQLAYSMTENIGLMANGYVRNNEVTAGDLKYVTRNTIFEGGAGYYDNFSKRGTFSTYAGIGFGEATHDERQYASSDHSNQIDFRQYSANAFRFFLQPSIGTSSDHIDFAFSTRLSSVSFNGIDTIDYHPQDLKDDNLYNLDKNQYLFIEPAITFRVGTDWAKIHSQLIYSHKLTQASLNYKSFVLNLGVFIHVTKMIDMLKDDGD